jgi:hypothetical protein
MPSDDFEFNDCLTPRDASTLPTRLTRRSSTFYPGLVDTFIASGEHAMEVNVGRIGRRPATVRAALVKAVKAGGHQERTRVSLIGDEIFLVRG